ncbi:U32 family peptidase [Salisediminibacterium beveridgei]|uniref:Peptidase n=1 Tax=Salisediminibacterium beveridgei TaxID=632773 RepID=A0A1D7QS66_9BACI|nr:U32 family peptidase [Salisediminibacterium beveridgei]AOM81850.1 hypothetical protein BBEV_0456 [Salisediminibacterium beveridgei]
MLRGHDESLRKLGLPGRDRPEQATSDRRFADGAQFRTEVSTVNSLAALEAVFQAADRHGIVVNRIAETYGIFRHRTEELTDMLNLCRERGTEINLSIGPRAPYDISPTAKSKHGAQIGYRLRGMDQVLDAVEDVRRAVSLGARGITLYDEGLLWVLHRMKKSGELPEDLQLKISAHAGQANPASFQLLESIGATSINPVRDLTLPMLTAIRESVDVPMDVHVDNPESSGGFVRIYDAPDMIRICSPMYLKSGNVMISGHGQKTSADNGASMVEQMSVVLEHIGRYYPDVVQSKPGNGPAIPVKV